MIESDTIRLLRECDSGVKMGVYAIGEVLPHTKNANFKRSLTLCMANHNALDARLRNLLHQYHDRGKPPSPIAKSMSRMKVNMTLAMHKPDQAVASLMADGCNMGVKSLSRYLNQYKAADEASRSIAKELILLEKGLADDSLKYL